MNRQTLDYWSSLSDPEHIHERRQIEVHQIIRDNRRANMIHEEMLCTVDLDKRPWQTPD